MTLSSSEPKPKTRRCAPGCECGRHRRKPAGGELAQAFHDAASGAQGLKAAFDAVNTEAVSVLVPARLDRERRDLWDFLQLRWKTLGYEIVEGDCSGLWCKAEAVADALSKASGQTLVIADADVWCAGVPQAVEAVRRGSGWAIPHYQVLRLTRPATAHVMSAGQWPGRGTMIRTQGGAIPAYAQRPYPGRPGGGIVVLSRASYQRVPLDPRFKGWGQEDESWALALGTLLGPPWRGTADLWHLWHDPAPRQSREVGSQASLNLHRRYVTANRQPARMQALVREFAS